MVSGNLGVLFLDQSFTDGLEISATEVDTKVVVPKLLKVVSSLTVMGEESEVYGLKLIREVLTAL